jgi:hypothetical protein
MSTVDSPYLAALRHALDSSQDEIERGAIQAEMAGYLARVGQFEEARLLVQDLRGGFGDGRSGRVTVLRMCAEALIAYCRDMDPASIERLVAAQALSVAGRSPPLIAYTSAWLSFVAFNLQRHEQMARAITVGMQSAGSSDRAALARLALSSADAHMLARNFHTARDWYERARLVAVDIGDHATMGGQILNSAVFGAFLCRLDAISRPVNDDRLRTVTREVKNALNYRAMTDIRPFSVPLRNAWASVLLLAGSFRAADEVLVELIAQEAAIGPRSNTTSLICDSIRCQAAYVPHFDVDTALARVDRGALEASAADDRAVACAALSVACATGGRLDLSRAYSELAADALAAYAVQAEQLERLTEGLPTTADFDRLRPSR